MPLIPWTTPNRTEFEAFDATCARSGWADWLVGVTDDPKRALFTTHRLRSSGDAWIARKAIDDHQAWEVEEYFRTVCKTKQGGTSGSLNHIFVYAYRLKPHTKP